MKNFTLLFFSFFILAASSGFSGKSISIIPTIPASGLFVAVGKGAEKISLIELSKISIKEYQHLSGSKLNLFQRLSFKMAQKKLQHDINSDGTINTATFKKYYSNEDHTTGFHFGGFALGFFLSLIGVGIAFFIGGDARRNRVNWALAGAAASLLIAVAVLRGGGY